MIQKERKTERNAIPKRVVRRSSYSGVYGCVPVCGSCSILDGREYAGGVVLLVVDKSPQQIQINQFIQTKEVVRHFDDYLTKLVFGLGF